MCLLLPPADVQAADYFMQFQYSWIADPLYFGDYPKIMRESQVTPRTAECDHIPIT